MKEDTGGCVLYLRIFAYEGKEVSVDVQLKTAYENRLRHLGIVTLDDGVYHVRRLREKHLHINSQSYGFNNEVVSEKVLYQVKAIHLIENDNVHYYFPKSVLDTYGSYLHFKEPGFELQQFLKLNILNEYRVASYESRLGYDIILG